MIAKYEGIGFRQIITGDRFGYGAEATTTGGIGSPDSAGQLVRLVRAALHDPRIGWIGIADCSSVRCGSPMPNYEARRFRTPRCDLEIPADV